MKKALVILLLAVLMLMPRKFKASVLAQEPDDAVIQGDQSTLPAETYPEGEDEIFPSSYEREMLARRFFQKTLPPLKRREKITWAFKTARGNILL